MKVTVLSRGGISLIYGIGKTGSENLSRKNWIDVHP
jgi:hypothetical protein